MKRILSLLTVTVILIALFSGYAFADGTPTLSVSDGGEAEPGDEISLTVDISDNPGIAAFTMTVTYDEERLELNKVKHTGMGGGTWLVNEDSVGWFAFHDYDYDGELLKLTFTVKDDAPNGDAAVSIGYTDGNIGNFDEETVYFDVEAGGVTISGGSDAPTEDKDLTEEANTDSTDSGNNSNSSDADHSSDRIGSTADQMENSDSTSSVGGNSQSTVSEDEEASTVIDSVSESERNSPEDVTVYLDENDTEELVEDFVLPAEDALEEKATDDAELVTDSSSSVNLLIQEESHSLLWLWIVLAIFVLVLVVVVLFLFVFKKDTGRH